MSDETIGTEPASTPAATATPSPVAEHGLDIGKVFEAISGIIDPAIKAGYLTTEHAFSYVVVILITMIGMGVVSVANVTPVVIALAVVGGAYSISRGLAKK